MTNLEITNAYVGNTQVAKICLGTDVVWAPEYYVEEDNGTMHVLLPSTPGPIADFEMDHNGSVTLYHNGEVLTAQSAVYQVIESCRDNLYTKEQRYLNDYAVQNVCVGCQYPTSTGKKRIIIGYPGSYGDNTLVVEADTFYCSGSTHTASVLLDGSVDIDLEETSTDMYEMAFSEPYTSITLYYDDEVVTASTLNISVDGIQSITETDYEVANIDTDTYSFSSINSISFYADSNDVYIDFTP